MFDRTLVLKLCLFWSHIMCFIYYRENPSKITNDVYMSKEKLNKHNFRLNVLIIRTFDGNNQFWSNKKSTWSLDYTLNKQWNTLCNYLWKGLKFCYKFLTILLLHYTTYHWEKLTDFLKATISAHFSAIAEINSIIYNQICIHLYNTFFII